MSHHTKLQEKLIDVTGLDVRPWLPKEGKV